MPSRGSVKGRHTSRRHLSTVSKSSALGDQKEKSEERVHPSDRPRARLTRGHRNQWPGTISFAPRTFTS